MPVASNFDWNAILQKEKKLDFFLNVTIPAARKRNDIVPHTLIICKYPRLCNFIIEKVTSQLIDYDIRFVESFGTQPGDLAAMLTNVADRTILCVNDGSCINRMSSTAFDILQQAISSYSIEIKIGKGIAAKSHWLDLPHFTLIACYENPQQIKHGLKQNFEYVIDIESFSDEEICAMEATAVAHECSITLEEDAISEIAKASNGDYRKAGRYVRWIRDYMLVKDDHLLVIPTEYVKKVIALQG